MKFIFKTIITIILAYICGLFLPFWAGAICIALLNIVYKSPFVSSLLSGLIGMSLAWTMYSWWLTEGPSMVIHGQISELFKLEPVQMHFLIGAVGGLLGGSAAFLGYSIQKLFDKKYSPYYQG